ncbi:MAG: hypothetical protein A2Z16_04865 [Chloroflexi bacterium RBG_16_54_18]|nr:MAG: hypothetical protein A2Z16_04865 [Chloroflexi bacterium RBG_16_54_18]
MRILFFSRDYTPHDHRILSSLAKTGHRVYYLRLEESEYVFEDRLLPQEIEVVQWNNSRRSARWVDGPGMLVELKSIAKKINPDLVQAGPLQRSALLAALAGLRPLISMSWGYDLLQDAGRNAIWRQATRFVLSHSDLMIGDCETIRRLAISYGMPDKRIVTFPWGIDLDHFSPRVNSTTASAADNRVREGTFTLLSTRSWEPIYGVDTIVQAYIQVSQTQPGIRLVMLGNGSLATDLKQRFFDVGLFPSAANLDSAKDARVIFPGQVGFSNLPESYRSSDLYISASHSDGTSISLLEALACGLPVLVSDIPGNREWVVPGVNGWLFTDGNPSALASAILEAFNDRNRLIEMGENARKSVEGRADWKANFQKLLQAYELVVNEN